MTAPHDRPADAGAPAPEGERHRFRITLVRVLLVQAATLLLLWLVHARYHVS